MNKRSLRSCLLLLYKHYSSIWSYNPEDTCLKISAVGSDSQKQNTDLIHDVNLLQLGEAQ